MTLVTPVEVTQTPARTPRGRGRRLWWAFGGVVVLAVLVAVATTVWIRHYSAAPGLTNDGGLYRWDTQDGTQVRSVSFGDVGGLEAQVRPHHAQAFEFWVRNPSAVTQTVLGLPGSSATAEPMHVLVSTDDPGRLVGDRQDTFRSAPVAIPPHQQRAVRVVLRSLSCWTAGRSETFHGVDLRVRVGAFTREEHVSFAPDSLFVLTSDRAVC